MRVLALVVVLVIALAGCAGSSRTTNSGSGTSSQGSYFSHASTCGAGTCGTPFDSGFDVPDKAQRLTLQVVVASGASGAVRLEIKDPDGTSVYAKTLTPAASQSVVENADFEAEAGRWTYAETYAGFSGTVSVSVTERGR